METVQAEGGVNVASVEWLQALQELCREYDILLIVDDIQTGNGRTGTFFSFERAGLRPDIVILSKSIGGMGLPMSLVLMAPSIDVWKPAEHTGTFRGNNLAFVAGAVALRYWEDRRLATEVLQKGAIVAKRLDELVTAHPQRALRARGCGLIHGLELPSMAAAKAVARRAFEGGLILELAGADDRVLKFIPPLTIDTAVLRRGLDIACVSIEHVLKESGGA